MRIHMYVYTYIYTCMCVYFSFSMYYSLLRTARQGLSKDELEEMLGIHERGLGQQWKDLAEALHADIKVHNTE